MKPMADKEVVCGRSGPGRSKSDFERGPKTGPQNDPKSIPIKLAKVRKPEKMQAYWVLAQLLKANSC